MNNNKVCFKGKLDKHTNILVHYLNSVPHFGIITSDTFRKTNILNIIFINWTQQLG